MAGVIRSAAVPSVPFIGHRRPSILPENHPLRRSLPMFSASEVQAIERHIQKEEEDFCRFCNRYMRLLSAARGLGYEEDEAARMVELWITINDRGQD